MLCNNTKKGLCSKQNTVVPTLYFDHAMLNFLQKVVCSHVHSAFMVSVLLFIVKTVSKRNSLFLHDVIKGPEFRRMKRERERNNVDFYVLM